MKEILAAIDEGGERGLDLSDEVRSRLYSHSIHKELFLAPISFSRGNFPEDIDAPTNPYAFKDALTSALLSAMADGSLTAEVLRTSAVLQKALAASGAGPETVAKMIALQKTLAESGMPKHEVSCHRTTQVYRTWSIPNTAPRHIISTLSTKYFSLLVFLSVEDLLCSIV